MQELQPDAFELRARAQNALQNADDQQGEFYPAGGAREHGEEQTARAGDRNQQNSAEKQNEQAAGKKV